MKILKPISTGLIAYQDFSLPSISPPLTANAEIFYRSTYIEFVNGSIYFNAAPYDTLVVVVDNTFLPTREGDMGGIKLVGGGETKELYEYYDPDNDIGAIPYVKLLKNNNVYSGYGSNNGLDWIYRGDVYFAPIDTIHISAIGESLYGLNSVKIYKSELITIHSLLPNYKVEAWQNSQKVAEGTAEGQSVSLGLTVYPFEGSIKVYDADQVLLSDVIVSDVWGGDEYSLSANVDIYDDNDIMLTFRSARHMGALSNGVLEKRFRIHNNNNYEINAVLSVADYSPFGNWVKLAKDENDLPDEYLDSITITLGANEDEVFWIGITRPVDADTTYDYKQNECLWYLTVS